MIETENPALPAALRLFSGFVILVLLVGGGLFFVPDLVKPRWPWPLAPFNARFLGAFYLAEMIAMALLFFWNRWSPARLILAMAFVFTLVVTVGSALHLEQFNFSRKSPWIWFVVYGVSVLVSGGFLWTARDTAPVVSVPGVAGRRFWFAAEAAALASQPSGHGRRTFSTLRSTAPSSSPPGRAPGCCRATHRARNWFHSAPRRPRSAFWRLRGSC